MTVNTRVRGEEKWRATYNTITVIQNFTKARITTCHLSRRDNVSPEFHRMRLPTFCLCMYVVRKKDFEPKKSASMSDRVITII